MRVLHILSSDDQYGSALCFLELLQCELKYEKIVPIVVTPKNNKINEKCNELKVKNYVVDYGQLQIPKHDKFYIFIMKYIYHSCLYYTKISKAEKAIIKIIKKEEIDIIHTNSSVIDIGAIVAKKTGLTNIWHLRELGKQDFNFYSANFHYIKMMNEDCNKFIAISEAVKSSWYERGLDLNRIVKIYDGVDASRFQPQKQSGYVDGRIRIVMCGSFCEAKGQQILVKSIINLNKEDKQKISVDFYGQTEGKYFKETKRLIIKNKLEDIFSFKGYVNNIPDLLSNYDVGVLCSRAEAFGRVTVEYMLAGLCTIAPLSGANQEIINNDGILYKADDIIDLTKAIKKVISNHKDYAIIGDKARKNSLKKYDINLNAKKIINFFMEQVPVNSK